MAHLDCLANCSLADCTLVEVLDLVLRLFGKLRLADLTVIECLKEQRRLLGAWENFGIVSISHLLSSGLVELEFVKLVFHILTEVAKQFLAVIISSTVVMHILHFHNIT